MRKEFVFVLVFILCLAGIAGASDAADTRYKGRTHTVAWDPALLETGAACTDCRYEIYLKNKVTGNETKIGETPEMQISIVIPLEGRYWAGGFEKRTIDGEDTVSPTVWSDTPEVCQNGQTFFLDWVAAPLGLKGLKKQP
jgi:hypothetical protein